MRSLMTLAFLATFATPAFAQDEHENPAEHAVEHAIDDSVHHGPAETNPIKNLYKPHWGKDSHGDTLEDGEEPLPPPFLAAWFNFALFAWVIARFGGPAIRDGVKKRHETIVTQLEESARLHQEAQRKLDEYTRRLAALEGDIDKMVSDVRREAETEKARIIADAQARAVRMKRDAEQQIQAEMRSAREDLERKAIEAAVSAAETILKERMGDQDQVLLANRFVDQVQQSAQRTKGAARPGVTP